MLNASAEKDFIVCDPFLGSGSSVIASIKKGCRFIGCDISEKAINTTITRVKKYIKENKDPFQANDLYDKNDQIKKVLSNGKFK